MASELKPDPRIQWSCTLYNALLHLYPERFRADYGREMELVFRDACREAFDQRGAQGMASLWGNTLADLASSVLENHIEEIFDMTQPTRVLLIRLCGAAAILGGVAWIIFASLAAQRPAGTPNGAYRETEDIILLFVGGYFLLVIGLFGQSVRSQGLTRLCLFLAGLCGLAGSIGLMLGSLWLDRFWVLLVGVPLLSFMLCLLAGAISLISKESTRWIGAILLGIVISTFIFNIEDWRVWFAVPAGLGWMALGYNLWINHSNPATPPPLTPA